MKMTTRLSVSALCAAMLAGCTGLPPQPDGPIAAPVEIATAPGAFLPRCWQGVSPRGLCLDGTGAVVELGLATAVTILPLEGR